MAWFLLLYCKERPQVAATCAHATCRVWRRTYLRIRLVVSELFLGGGPPGHRPVSLHSEGTSNTEDTPVRRWICLSQGHHHLHLMPGRGSGGDGRLPPRVAVAVCHPRALPGERSTPGAVPGGRPSPGTRGSNGGVTRRPPGLLPGRTGRSRDATREPSSVERIQLGFDSRFVS